MKEHSLFHKICNKRTLYRPDPNISNEACHGWRGQNGLRAKIRENVSSATADLIIRAQAPQCRSTQSKSDAKRYTT